MTGNQLLRKLVGCLLSLCVAGALTGATQVERSRNCGMGSWQLPLGVKPVHYELGLKVDSDISKYAGNVAIELQFDKAGLEQDRAFASTTRSSMGDQRTIILNADGRLNIEEIDYFPVGSDKSIPVMRACFDEFASVLVLTWDDELKPGTLKIAFNGQINAYEANGLFRSDYAGHQGKPVVATRFEPSHARKAFPCFDEPNFKATFGLTIEHVKGLKALSNMPQIKEEIVKDSDASGRDFVRVQFERTHPMPTNLLAFVVGEFGHIETTFLDGEMTIGMWTPPNRAEEARPVLEHAKKVFTFLRDYFNLDQPIKKIDFVALDSDPSTMENWGLVTMNTTDMLNTVHKSTSHYYTARSLTQQWLGGLVTPMKWWDDLWIKEGLAGLMVLRINDELKYDPNQELTQLLDSTTIGLQTDADLRQTHSVKNKQLVRVDQIEMSFDEIVYYKSTSVLQMIEKYVGKDNFRKGLQKFVSTNMFKNADSDDLLAALKSASGLDVKSMADNWINRNGFPLIGVQYGSVWLGHQSLHLTQSIFPSVVNYDEVKNKHNDYIKWTIPMSIIVSNGVDKTETLQFVMKDHKTSIKLPSWFKVDKPGHWLKVNANFEGFYRVQYKDQSLLDALQAAIKNKLLGPADRLNILNDARAMYLYNIITIHRLKDILSSFIDEDNPAVMIETFRVVSLKGTLSLYKDVSTKFAILERYYRRTGGLSFSSERDALKERAQRLIVTFLVSTGDRTARNDCLGLFDKGEVAQHLQEAVYIAVAIEGSDEQYLDLLAGIVRMDPGNERNRMMDLILRVTPSERYELANEYFANPPNDTDQQ